jgi:hypothetical protein
MGLMGGHPSGGTLQKNIRFFAGEEYYFLTDSFSLTYI